MSHHHRHHHRDPHRRRVENLAWLGIVLVVMLLVFFGLALLTANPHISATPTQPPVITVNPPLGPVQGEPPPIEVEPPVVDQPKDIPSLVPPVVDAIPGYGSDGSVIPIPNPDSPAVDQPPPVVKHPHVRHRRHHRHHARYHVRHHAAYACYWPATIPGYAADGSVVAIPNPDCNQN